MEEMLFAAIGLAIGWYFGRRKPKQRPPVHTGRCERAYLICGEWQCTKDCDYRKWRLEQADDSE